MRKATLVMATALVATAATLMAAETTRWVERTKVDVRAGRGSYYEVVDTVLKGEQVEIIQTEGGWVTVRTPRDKVGWVFAAALSAKPVQPGGGSDFLKLAPGDASTSRTAASQGAKGLYAQDYAKAKGYDYAVVDWVEGHQPTSPQIDAFLKDTGESAGGRR
jgi:uncharacterized protein YgiM (DUF1202 family)